MQINKEDKKKIKKFLSFNNPIASKPIISPIVTFDPALEGGVLGNVKLKIPIKNETAAANLNVFFSELLCSHASHPMISPATIQPTVPQTRIFAKSFSGSPI